MLKLKYWPLFLYVSNYNLNLVTYIYFTLKDLRVNVPVPTEKVGFPLQIMNACIAISGWQLQISALRLCGKQNQLFGNAPVE